MPIHPAMAVVTTSGWAGTLSGKLGGVVFVETPHGTILRASAEGERKQSPLQMASEARMTRASRAFGELTRDEGQAWAAFGRTLAEAHPKTGRAVCLSGQQAFNRLANKLLQIDAQATLPRVPPSTPFFGDGVRMTIAPIADGIVFTADAPNRVDVLTELLLQPLASQHRRTYAGRYRTQGFVHFTLASLNANVGCGPGWYAVAVRFVEAATGRTTTEIELGVVQVG